MNEQNKTKATLLIEIGVEELPHDMVSLLSETFANELASALCDARFSPGGHTVFGAARRMAVSVGDVAACQPVRSTRRKGPALRIAFDDSGAPTQAARGFAKSCGVAIDEVEQKDGYLWALQTDAGKTLDEFLNEVLPEIIRRLPLTKRMRWDVSEHEFIRPVRWLCALHGSRLPEITVCGCFAEPRSYGHRHHWPQAIPLANADDYESALENAFVVARGDARARRTREGINRLAQTVGGHPPGGSARVAVASAMAEWPCAVLAEFDSQFLSLPAEVVICTLESEQNIIPLTDTDGRLLPSFIVITDVESKDPAEISRGYARVVRARLSDADFFYRRDMQSTLASRESELDGMVYIEGLGTLRDKTERVKKMCAYTAEVCGADNKTVARAAQLSKCELATELVAERPELEGAIGAAYAGHDGEAPEVVAVLREYRMPLRADDALPATREAIALALADRLDTLAGIIGVGRAPTGDRDPYGVRRVAIAIIRIIIECDIRMPIDEALRRAVANLPDKAGKNNKDSASPDVETAAAGYIIERLRAYYQRSGENPNIVTAVLAAQKKDLADINRRVKAVRHFMTLPQAENLAAANKRIHHILKKNKPPPGGKAGGGTTTEEKMLHQCLKDGEAKTTGLIKNGEYVEAMNALATFADPLETFFQNVMVMSESADERNNRLALLAAVRKLFLSLADFSALAGERE